MALSSTFGLLVIFALAAYIIIRPLLEESNTRKSVLPGKYDSLLAERERLFSSIEDLDLAFDLQKISSLEHTRSRDLLLKEAAEVLKQLDKVETKLHKTRGLSAPPTVEDDLEKMIEARRLKLKGEKPKFCSHCGKPVKSGDQYCTHCGEEL